MATRNDVAKQANVSPATVSFVLNGSKKISPEVRKQVLDAAKKLNYQPNYIARSLVTKRTHHVGIVLNELQSASISEIVTSFESNARENGYMTSLILMQKNIEGPFQDIIKRRIDGLFISISFNGFTQELIQQLQQNKTALVTGDCFMTGISSVRCDYQQGLQDLISFLKDNGHKKIGFISGIPLKDPTNLRYQSYRFWLDFYGLKTSPEYCIDFQYDGSIQNGYLAAKALLQNTDITAIITLNDQMAIGALKYCYDQQISVPNGISVCSCDGNNISDNLCPPLSYISCNKQFLGKSIFTKLLELIDGGQPTITLVPMRLHTGKTVGPVKEQT